MSECLVRGCPDFRACALDVCEACKQRLVNVLAAEAMVAFFNAASSAMVADMLDTVDVNYDIVLCCGAGGKPGWVDVEDVGLCHAILCAECERPIVWISERSYKALQADLQSELTRRDPRPEDLPFLANEQKPPRPR